MGFYPNNKVKGRRSFNREVRTKVDFYWNSTMGVYNLHMHYLTDKGKEVVRLIKQMIPGTERDYSGPPDYTWYIHEKHMPALKLLIENIPEMELIFVEKPVGAATVKFTPTEVHIEKFKELTGIDPTIVPFNIAKKAFFKASMIHHPDVNNGFADKMYELNVAWEGLQIQHYKTKQLVTEMTGA